MCQIVIYLIQRIIVNNNTQYEDLTSFDEVIMNNGEGPWLMFFDAMSHRSSYND